MFENIEILMRSFSKSKEKNKKVTEEKKNQRFEKIFEYLLKVEGVYSNDKNDKGGATKYGIIEAEARKHGYKGSMRNMPLSLARKIYEKDYFYGKRLDEITDDRISLSICDWAVNSGYWGIKKAQQALNKINGSNLTVDGKMGKETLDALNNTNPEKFLEVYHELQRNFYHNIVRRNPDQKKFLKGWLNRVDRKEKFIKTSVNQENGKIIKKVKENLNETAIIENKETERKNIRRFESIFKYLMYMDEGYSNQKNGKTGGEKYKNIEEEARKKGYKGDMRNIPMEMIRELYMEKYFYGNKLNKIVDYRIALSVCDWIVSSGTNGVKKVQEMLNILNGNNDLAVDGIIGKYTLRALNNVDPEKFLKAYYNLEREYYNNIAEKYPEQKVFLKGWQNKIDKKENYIKNNMDEKNAGDIKNSVSLKNEISSKIKMSLDEKGIKNVTEMKVR